MLRSLLVPLDGSAGGQAARALALDLAKRNGALVTGIGVLDLDALTVPIGFFSESLAYSEIDRSAVIESQEKDLDRLADEFKELCAKEGLRHEVIMRRGSAFTEIARTALIHDLIVIGNDTKFGDVAGRAQNARVSTLLKHNPRAVVATPPSPKDGDDILFAFDGSTPAARAMQMFALLEIGRGLSARVMTIHKKGKVAEAMLNDGIEFLARHEIKATPRVIESNESPITLILDEMKAKAPRMLVMGAFGHGGWREMLLGSATVGLLGFSRAPIFVDH